VKNNLHIYIKMLYKKIFINNCYLKLLLIFYFSFFSFKNFMKGCGEVCDCCPDCCKKYWNKYFNKNKQEREIIQEEEEEKENYKEEKNITPKNFTPDKTLKKLKTNWKTYLLVIFKTRLFPHNSNNGDIYEKRFQDFCKKYYPKTFFEFLTEETFVDFSKKVLDNCKFENEIGVDNSLNIYDVSAFNEYKDGLLEAENKFLIYALLTDGDEKNICNKILEKIRCTIYNDEGIKMGIIGNLIDIFKRQIIETIKGEVIENRKIEERIYLDIKERIKQQAQENYNAAIDGHNEGKITLHFYDAYNVRKVKGDLEIAKNVKLSALFDYVLYNGRTFYYFNAEENQEEKDDVIEDDIKKDNIYASYDDEKARLVLKDNYSPLVGVIKILNNEIKKDENITIWGFYKSNEGKVYMFFDNKNNMCF